MSFAFQLLWETKPASPAPNFAPRTPPIAKPGLSLFCLKATPLHRKTCHLPPTSWTQQDRETKSTSPQNPKLTGLPLCQTATLFLPCLPPALCPNNETNFAPKFKLRRITALPNRNAILAFSCPPFDRTTKPASPQNPNFAKLPLCKTAEVSLR